MKEVDKTGLALGGGAAFGAAHVGVLKAIHEAGIKIDYITGTSIGAFVAALYAFGKSWQEMEEIALDLKWIDITNLSLSKYGLLSNKKLGELLIEHIGDQNIEDSKIPLAMIATDIATGEKVVLDSGSVANAVIASACIPGIFKPIELNRRLLVDGGIVENVPVITARNMGANFVIGVDLNSNYTSKKPDHILDVILNSFHFVLKETAKKQTEGTNVLICPDLSAYSRSDIQHVPDMIHQGYEAATKALNNAT